MKPKADPASLRHQGTLFAETSPTLIDFIDLKHPLVRMADTMVWETFESQWSRRFSTAGGPMASSGRRVAGLLMLKHMEALSDERLIEAWICNPYFQYFCGETHFQHRPPVDPATLVKWRKRLGEEGLEWLLGTVLDSALTTGAIKQDSLAHLSVDSAVMEKNIAYPTDSGLMEKLRVKLVSFMQDQKLSLRQSYARQGPRLAQRVGRFAHARQFKRMKRALAKQRTWVGRLQRELERQLDSLCEDSLPQAQLLINQAKQLIAQSKDPKSKNKLYALHEPDVDCISKGKAHKRYEFGVKVGIACTQKEGYVVGIRSYPGNPYDGHTLDDQLMQAETLTAITPKTVVVDLGYRGRHSTQAQIIHRGKKLSKRQKQRLKRRSAIEAMIGHMKNDGLLDRCHLKGTLGDALHAILCGVGHNLRLLRNYWEALLFWLFYSRRFGVWEQSQGRYLTV